MALKPGATSLPIVDTHQHLWDLSRFRLPWLERVPQLNRSFLMSDYLEATAGLHVVQTVYMEVDLATELHVEEAQYVLDMCACGDNPMAAAVIGGRPESAQFQLYLDRFAGNPNLKGVRRCLHVPETPPGYCLAEQFVKNVRLLGERGLSFDLVVRPDDLRDAIQLVKLCPDTRFILDHCGNGNVQATDRSQWEHDISRLAQLSNVIGKVSGIVVTAKPYAWRAEELAPIVRHVISEFGWDRVIFGGDWPVCTLAATYRQWSEALQWIIADAPLEDQRKLLHDNAVKFYGLPKLES